MAEQQIDRDTLRRKAKDRYTIFIRPDDLLALLDQLDQAEARIRHLEAAAQVLVKEALDGLADDFDMWHQDMHTDEVARRIRHEMKLLYPKETP